MVGSGGSERSKEAVGMMALHEALRTVCLNTDWTYSVFWTIRPRPRVRGGNGCKVGDDNGSLMLMWEDGYCRSVEEIEGEDAVRKAFSKMSIQLYNYGEGLMGKVASDKCHKWVFKEPTECEPNVSNYWQSSFDALPPEWTDQFESGIQTIAVIQAGHGLLQLGSAKIIPEDLHFVLRMRHTFESLGYQSGFYLSQLFSSNRNNNNNAAAASIPGGSHRPPPPPLAAAQQPPPHPPAALFNSWAGQRNLNNNISSGGSMLPNFEHGFLGPPRPAENSNNNNEQEGDIKWPSGLSIFNALTGRATDEAKYLFDPDNLGNKPPQPMPIPGADPGSLNKFKRSFTLPARMVSSSSSTSMDHHHHHDHHHNHHSHHHHDQHVEAGMYQDAMDNYLGQ